MRGLSWLDEVDSTSDEARRRVEQGGDELPFLVGTNCQTRGRGRGSHVWWSDGGSLTATVVLDPAALGLGRAHEPRIALAVAVAIIEAIEALHPGCRPGIRWPNDVEVGGRKLGGLLPERVEAAEGPRLLIGFGLNVETRLEAAPGPVRAMAASLVEWAPPGGLADARFAVLRAILDRLGPTLRALAADDPALAERWDRLDLLRGQPVRIDQGGSILAGTGAGIDAAGALRLDTGRGLLTVLGGQVLRAPTHP